MRTLARVAVGSLALALALALGACSRSEELEDLITKVFAEDAGVEGIEVTCPDDVDTDEGDVVECTAEGDFSDIGIDAERVVLEISFTADDQFEVTDIAPAE